MPWILWNSLPAAVKTVREVSKRPLILIGSDPAALDSSLSLLPGEGTLIYAADSSNYEALAEVAKKHKAALVVNGDSLDALAELTPKIQAKGVEDMVLDLGRKNLGEWLTRSTQARRLALKANCKPMGYPSIFFAAQNGTDREAVYAAQAIAKYAGFVVLDTFAPELVYPLIVLRENIYTDPWVEVWLVLRTLSREFCPTFVKIIGIGTIKSPKPKHVIFWGYF